MSNIQGRERSRSRGSDGRSFEAISTRKCVDIHEPVVRIADLSHFVLESSVVHKGKSSLSDVVLSRDMVSAGARQGRKSRWGDIPEQPPVASSVANAVQGATSFSAIPVSIPPGARIYVGSLDFNLTEFDIRALFESFGEIVSIDMKHDNGKFRGFCFIDFRTTESGEMALRSMTNFMLRGRPLKLGRPDKENSINPIKVDYNIMQAALAQATIVANTRLASEGLEQGPQQLNSMIKSFQQEPVPMSDYSTNGMFDGSQRINNNLNTSGAPQDNNYNSNSKLNDGQNSSVVNSANNNDCNTRIYIGNIPPIIQRSDLMSLFKFFGTIRSCHIQPNPDDPSHHKGFGFIEYSEPIGAHLAISNMHNFAIVEGCTLKVNYAVSSKVVSKQSLGSIFNPAPPSALQKAEEAALQHQMWNALPPPGFGPLLPLTDGQKELNEDKSFGFS